MNKEFAMKLLTDGAQAHKEMWTWLSENPSADKFNWPGLSAWRALAKVPISCFGCEMDDALINAVPDRADCDSCPLVKSSASTKQAHIRSGCLSGLFSLWLCANKRPEDRSKIALTIANLEWVVSEEDAKAVTEFFKQQEV